MLVVKVKSKETNKTYSVEFISKQSLEGIKVGRTEQAGENKWALWVYQKNDSGMACVFDAKEEIPLCADTVGEYYAAISCGVNPILIIEVYKLGEDWPIYELISADLSE